jgi:hypothetical protein
MKMELFYIAEITEKVNFEDNAPKEKIAKFISGPFGSWDLACDAKQKASDKRLSRSNIEIVTQTIEVDVD